MIVALTLEQESMQISGPKMLVSVLITQHGVLSAQIIFLNGDNFFREI